MSIIKPNVEKVSAETWITKILDEWRDGAVAMTVIKNKKDTLFEEKLTVDNAWEWCRLLL